MGNSNSNDGVKSSDYDPSLPDNKAESDAAKHASKESPTERWYNDAKAKDSADSLWDSIFGKDKK